MIKNGFILPAVQDPKFSPLPLIKVRTLGLLVVEACATDIFSQPGGLVKRNRNECQVLKVPQKSLSSFFRC